MIGIGVSEDWMGISVELSWEGGSIWSWNVYVTVVEEVEEKKLPLREGFIFEEKGKVGSERE